MSYLDELNDVQRKAVTTTDGPVLVIAGPGSGKTRVLTYRIAYLIETGVPPWEILALTFTNKAAKEMKERIAKVVGNKANKVWAGTFHSIFARILRVEGEKIGFPSNFSIYDTEDSKSLLKKIIKQKNLDPKVYHVNSIASRISSAKSQLITPRAYEANEELRMQDRSNGRPHLHDIYATYMKECKKAGAMDFDDLLYQMFYLLYSNPNNVVDKYRKRFKYVLVDEFQDTNHLQYAIVKKLVNYDKSPQNICVVGDDAQSIYAFRGATIQNILDFENDYKNLQTFKLEQNYRSTEYIVQAANDIITYNTNQIPKKIWSNKGTGHKIKVLEAPSDNDEAKRVAGLILEQKTRYHLYNKDIAILYRTNAQSRGFEEALRRQNISYRVYGGLSFYQRKEVKDLLAYLRVTINPSDSEALRRVINYPKRGIGKTTVAKIDDIAAKSGRTMWEEIKNYQGSGRTANSIRGFVLMIEQFRKRAEKQDAHELAQYVAKQSGILTILKNDNSVEGSNRLENVVSLLDSIKDFVENDEIIDEATLADKKLNTYLQTIALHTTADDDKDQDRVTLMSVHSAKGLEYKSVFVTGMEEKLFPSFMSLESKEAIDEERRLFYVAVTRSEEFLTLTYAKSRYRHGEMRYSEPSRFLKEIAEENLEPINPMANTRSRVSGVTPGQRTRFNTPTSPPSANIPDFSPSPPSAIKQGLTVLHKRFGRGTVVKIDGPDNNKIATIRFEEAGEKRIMLKFAKLGIV